MALYHYQALSKDGKTQKGFVDASSLSNARDLIVKKGLYVVNISLSESASAEQPWYKKIFAKKVDFKEKILFTKQLGVLLKSGIPLLQALELLIEQFEGYLRSIIIRLKDGIKEGQSLAEGLKKFPKVFDQIYIQLVRAGEATGKLETILERLTVFLERRQQIEKKVKSALRYPLTQLTIVALVVVFLLTKVVPQISQVFKQQGGNLPKPTQILLTMSNFMKSHYIILLVIIVSLFLIIRFWKATESGAKTLDKIKLRLPLIRYFAKTSAVVQFSRTLGMLLESGVNLPEALDIVVNIIDNRVLADALMEARDKIIKQGKIAQFLKQTNIFPSIAIYLINSGEQTGELPRMLNIVAENYEDELFELTESLTTKIEPIMMLVMAGVVGFIVISIALPLVKMNELVSK